MEGVYTIHRGFPTDLRRPICAGAAGARAGGGERGWRRAAARGAPRRTLCLGQVPCAMSCTCFRVACIICSLLLPMRCAALAPGRNATKERGWSCTCMRGCRLVVQRGLSHICAGAAWLCSVQNAGQTSESSLARTTRHLHACEVQSIGGGESSQRRKKLVQMYAQRSRYSLHVQGLVF